MKRAIWCAVLLIAAAIAGPARLANAATVTRVFTHESLPTPFVVPAGVTSVTFTLEGAGGGSGGAPGGNGARVVTDLAVTPGETLFVRLGGPGGNSHDLGNGGGGANGGVAGGFGVGAGFGGGGGGGETDVSRGGTTPAHRVLVAAGGGGGAGTGTGGAGGAGGSGGAVNFAGSAGAAGAPPATGGLPGSGGSATTPGVGGSGPGEPGEPGFAFVAGGGGGDGVGTGSGAGGGGGGGLFGGGGGAGGLNSGGGGGAGAGSSLAPPSSLVDANGGAGAPSREAMGEDGSASVTYESDASGQTAPSPAFAEPGGPITVGAAGVPSPSTEYRLRLSTQAATCPLSGFVVGGPVVSTPGRDISPVGRIIPTTVTPGTRWLCWVEEGDPGRHTEPAPITVF